MTELADKGTKRETKMTEQEIVSYLKENKTKGIAFAFMPEEVRDWVNDASRKIVYLIFKSGLWEELPVEATANEEDVFALPDSFQIKQEPQSGWVEFEIKSEVFDYDDRVFDWWDWGCFLNYCKGYNTDDFTAFGGWQYEGSESWFMTPRLAVISPNLTIYQDNYNPNNYAECECKPAIPIRIRFWREAK